MSDLKRAVAEAWNACEGAIRGIDASLSVLVVARENVIARMQALSAIAEPPANPQDTAGHEPDPHCAHDGQRIDMGNGTELCVPCGEQVPDAGV